MNEFGHRGSAQIASAPESFADESNRGKSKDRGNQMAVQSALPGHLLPRLLTTQPLKFVLERRRARFGRQSRLLLFAGTHFCCLTRSLILTSARLGRVCARFGN